MTRWGASAVGLLALAALGGCAPSEDDPAVDDSLAACFAPYSETCFGEAALSIYRTCYDGRGSCTWSETRGDNSYQLLLEWENGARYETSASGTSSMTTIRGSSGELCTVQLIDMADCRGARISSSERWYQYCAVYDQAEKRFVTAHYTCDNGEQMTLPIDTPSASTTSPMCSMDSLERYRNCVDADGRHLLDDSTAAPPGDPPCQGASCGDIGSRCTDAMRCDPGLSCQSTNVDPSVVYGFCTGPCDDAAPCPAGLTCTRVLQPATNTIRSQCMRPCRESADCAPFGSHCGTGTNHCY